MAALVLSVINCTSICRIQQIQLEIWPEPGLSGFPKMARFLICQSQNLVQTSAVRIVFFHFESK